MKECDKWLELYTALKNGKTIQQIEFVDILKDER